MLIKPERKQKVKSLKTEKVKTNLLMLVVIIVCVFSSCQKEIFDEVVPVNPKFILTQLAKIQLPTEEEVKVKLSEQQTLKFASVAPVSAKIFALSDYTCEIKNDKAVKTGIYIEVNNSGYFSRVFTLYQTFKIIDGKIDDTKYDLKVQAGCPFSKVIKVKDELNTNYIWYWAHIYMESGEELGYFDPNEVFSESHRIEIYPIKGVTWEIQVGANVQYGLGKSRYEILSVPSIVEDLFIKNKDSESDIEVGVNFNLAKESTSFLEIPKDHYLWNCWADFWIESLYFYGEGDKLLRLEVGAAGAGDSSKRIFPSPFALSKIQVVYRGENLYLSESHNKTFSVRVSRIEGGKTYYTVGDELD